MNQLYLLNEETTKNGFGTCLDSTFSLSLRLLNTLIIICDVICDILLLSQDNKKAIYLFWIHVFLQERLPEMVWLSYTQHSQLDHNNKWPLTTLAPF